ncbi:MAG: hypothetical protein ACSHYA_16835 [Opitutaceae bacterium]
MNRFILALLLAVTHSVLANQPASFIEAENFLVYSDSRLSGPQAKRIRQTIENTYKVVQALPIALSPEALSKYNYIRIVDHPISLEGTHGARNAAGVYQPQTNHAIIHFKSKGGSRADHKTLAHEITHQLQAEWLETLPVWLSEGLAVYVAALPYSRNGYDSTEIDIARSPELLRYTSKKVHFIELDGLLDLNRTEWNELFEANPHGVDSFYRTSYLLTHYFLHMTDASKLEKFCSDMSSGDLESSLRRLLDGQSVEQLQMSLIEAFAKEEFTLVPMSGYFSN